MRFALKCRANLFPEQAGRLVHRWRDHRGNRNRDGSLKRFEQTGKISLESLLKIAVVLGASEPFSDLFKTTEITSIQQIIDGEFD